MGRHFRLQDDTANPRCDYEQNGQQCNYYNTSEFANIPYPANVPLGPMSDPQPPLVSQNPEIASILALLREQKENAEAQASQMRILQGQVSSLMQDRTTHHDTSSNLIPVSSSQALPNPIHFQPQIPVSTASNPVSVTSSVSLLSLSQAAPTTVVNAAASLTSALQSGLGHNHIYGYSALTIDQLRRDPVLVTQASLYISSSKIQGNTSDHYLNRVEMSEV